jgi:hypothetical protein
MSKAIGYCLVVHESGLHDSTSKEPYNHNHPGHQSGASQTCHSVEPLLLLLPLLFSPLVL